jgi:site-specific recombinase XerC
LPEAQIRVRGKGNKIRFLPLAPEAAQLLDHYLRLERPANSPAALFVSLKGPARGARMTPRVCARFFAIIARLAESKLQIPTVFDTPSHRIWFAPALACPPLCS